MHIYCMPVYPPIYMLHSILYVHVNPLGRAYIGMYMISYWLLLAFMICTYVHML